MKEGSEVAGARPVEDRAASTRAGTQDVAAAPNRAMTQAARPAHAGAPPLDGSGARGINLLHLQRVAGNRAVNHIVAETVQRVRVDASVGETLYNQETGGQATAGHYSVTGNYDMTRQGDTGVTVTVKIRFVNQRRNTVPPTPPADTPFLGQLMDSPSEIPAGDPRRSWAQDMANAAVTNWNGRLTFTGEETNILSANTRKRLPVTFTAVPVWGLNEDANAQVVVHPPSSIGGAPGHPIDAGNWYQQRNPNVYPAEENVIYAHEYGHLLGIPDEYSQSNRQMHLLLHQANPNGAATAMAALNRATVERMALEAVSVPLRARLNTVMPQVVAALQAQQPLVNQRMSRAAREGMRDAGVLHELQTRLTQVTEGHLHASVPQTAAFQATTNFSARTRAVEGVGAEFATPALTNRIAEAYRQAIEAPHAQPVAVAGLGDVSINMSSGVSGMGQGTGPVAGAAEGLKDSTVGPRPPAPGGGAAGGGSPGLPAVPPSTSLLGQLTAMPATWSQAGSALESSVTPAAFAAQVRSILTQANLNALFAGVVPGLVPEPRETQIRGLYRRAYDIVRNASVEAATQVSRDLLSSTLTPLLQGSVTALQAAIHAEVERVMNTPPGTLAAAPADPNMAALVSGMQARLLASQAATAAQTSRDPLGAGQGAPAQDVTYSYQGLMGSNATTELRTDQFRPMVNQFNEHLTNMWENDFTAEAR